MPNSSIKKFEVLSMRDRPIIKHPGNITGRECWIRLVKEAESVAVNRGCKRCFLTTFEFQARIFSEKQGYAVVGKLDDYQP